MAKVRFSVNAPGAKDVYLAGEFNGWDEKGQKMRRSPKTKGLFVCSIELEPGRYEYKFVVDGQWICDEDAPRVPNSFGSENSVIVV